MKKFFVSENQIVGEQITIEGDEFYHLSTVLRTNINEKIVVLDNTNYEYHCVVEKIEKDKAIAKIINKFFCTANPKVQIDVFQGLPKGEKLELIVQKITELGATTLIPFESDFTIAKNNPVKLDRMNKISQEACKQCGRSKKLIIADTINIRNIKQFVSKYDIVIFLYEGSLIINKLGNVYDKLKVAKRIGIIVGSEGGFSPSENDFLSELPIEKICLGRRILRTETATIAMVAYLSFLTGN